jgi:sugar phosphate isomerase/epimerase
MTGQGVTGPGEWPWPVGVCAAAFGDMEIGAALGAIRQIGLDHIDLPTDSTLRLLPGIDALEQPGYPAYLTATLRRHSVTVSCVSNSEGFTGIAYVEHEDVLLPRAQGIASAADRLRALLPASPPEGRTW